MQQDIFTDTKIPAGICQCGCGVSAPILKKSNPIRGHIAGQFARFIPGHNTRGRNGPKQFINGVLHRICPKCQSAVPPKKHKNVTRWPCMKCSKTRYREIGRIFRWERTIREAHGLTAERYKEILSIQNGKCAICDRDKNVGHRKNFDVDHDHKTGEIRGLLCSLCNNGLGSFKDSIDRLYQAIDYLKVHLKTP